MPSPLPSSFASAAAGNTNDLSTRRGDGSGEWSRSRMNGATQTFRRPSVATNPSYSRDSSQPTSASTPTAGAYIPPHMSSNYQPNMLRNGAPSENRYTKDQLLNLYKIQRESGNLGKSVADYFVADWTPHVEASALNGAWGKRDDPKDVPSGPEVCWDHGGHSEPLGLADMTDDEREMFSGSVNSPLKPPPSNIPRGDNAGAGAGGRKLSASHNQGHMNTYNTSSPGSVRPGPRRRETGDSIGNAMSPTAGGSRFLREEPNTSTPPPSLLRRKTDFRDATSGSKLEERDKDPSGHEGETTSPFGSLKRSNTNPLASGAGGTSSPWGSASQSASFSPMGTFGAFNLGSGTGQTPTEKKSSFGSLRGESRFKGLLSKDSSEDIPASAKERTSIGNLERLSEQDSEKRSQSPWGENFKTRTGRSDTNPFVEEPRSGSAALGGSQDIGGPSQDPEQLGFSAFGMTPSIPGFRELMQSDDHSRNPSPSLLQGHEPTSPTNTNPYQSPHGEKAEDDVDTDGSDIQSSQPHGLGGLRESSGPFGSMRRVGSGLDMPSIDRSQTSSAAGNRNFPGLGGLGGHSNLGGSSGWPSSSAAVGTPTREKSAFASGFGDPIFGSMADLQSPSLSTLGGGGFFGSNAGMTGSGSIGRSSKLGSLFPTSMQEQTQGDQARQEFGGFDEGTRQPDFQADKPGQMSQSASVSASQTPVSAVGSIPTAVPSGHDVAQPGQVPGQTPTSVPPAQQRTMVMPDRMRWIYRDPQGNIQGPWTGLEMHDWFKAGFFSPDLQIKKLEDPEFEPLAQLVRRIGNSREPFLVPQIGIPHGPEPGGGGGGAAGAGAGAGAWTASSTTGSAQPPFPGSFPSFGTTLTAEQQNALERRKQEEQYLMARQKEHLAQQQALMKQMQMQGVSQGVNAPQLQHHSSAHSLHSQPSFGSLTSPLGYQPSPIQGPMHQQQQPGQGMPGLLDAAGSMRQSSLPNVGPQMIGADMGSGQDQLPALLDRLNVNRPEPFAFGSPSLGGRQPENAIHSQQVATMLQDRARLQQEQEQFDSAHGDSLFDQQAREERLRQFHALRTQEGESGLRTAEGLPTHPATGHDLGAAAPAQQVTAQTTMTQESEMGDPGLSLSQQVQKAASARQQQEEEQQSHVSTEVAWTSNNESGLPRPFPPPPSASPLPAPAAQRSRQNVAESLAANSRSQTQTPVEAPATTIAPWAREANEVPKGPSLKEIQEAEARSAAQKEEVAAAARRAQLIAEQERISQTQAPAPGLPSTANWASGASTAAPAPGSVWNNKGPSTAASGARKTLAQIQKEEETRKQRMVAAAAAVSQNAAPSPPAAAASTAKRYADLAGKSPASAASAPAPAAGSGAWTTVGAGGKPKAPPVSSPAPRAASGNIPAVTAAPKPKPVAAAPRTVSASTSPPSNPNRALEEFTKWAKLSLSRGLNSDINVDDFVQQLLLLPAEAEIISDSVYANSQTLDGRRFAEEFIRRRKLADKGIVDPVAASAFAEQKNGGEWSEVAKKGSSNAHREDDSDAAFRVVAPRKKGKR